MLEEASLLLVEVIDDELEAQQHLNPAKFEITIDASIFEYSSIWHGLLQFHV
jgi:hypothetical protein